MSVAPAASIPLIEVDCPPGTYCAEGFQLSGVLYQPMCWEVQESKLGGEVVGSGEVDGTPIVVRQVAAEPSVVAFQSTDDIGTLCRRDVSAPGWYAALATGIGKETDRLYKVLTVDARSKFGCPA